MKIYNNDGVVHVRLEMHNLTEKIKQPKWIFANTEGNTLRFYAGV